VNLEKRKDNVVFLGYYSTQKVAKAKILLKRKGDILLDKVVEISPEKTFTESVKSAGPLILLIFQLKYHQKTMNYL